MSSLFWLPQARPAPSSSCLCRRRKRPLPSSVTPHEDYPRLDLLYTRYASNPFLEVVEPALMAPLRPRWEEIRGKAEALIAERGEVQWLERSGLREQIGALLTGFSDELASVRVLELMILSFIQFAARNRAALLLYWGLQTRRTRAFDVISRLRKPFVFCEMWFVPAILPPYRLSFGKPAPPFSGDRGKSLKG